MKKLYFFICFFLCSAILAASQKQTTYIVHISETHIPAIFSASLKTWYQSLLNRVLDSKEVKNVTSTYSTILKGFASQMTEEEADLLRRLPFVLAVLPDRLLQLQTTRTPQFLGLNKAMGLLPESKEGEDIIIGLLDTGVWPNNRYYNYAGLGPISAKWKGECTAGTNFSSSNCNKKLIGAQFFCAGYEALFGPLNVTESRSPLDDDGHGTHTSSTAGGARVPGASFFGYAAGTASGMAPGARIAVYKVCWAQGCATSDILSAMDKAVADGVDIISLSLAGGPMHFFLDNIAIGAFAAIQRGVFVSCAAGNSGPETYTVTNVAPWIMTVGAGTIDREFPAYVLLGSGKNYTGASIYRGKPLPMKATVPLVRGRNNCSKGSLMGANVTGKIVVCEPGFGSRLEKGAEVKAAGGVAMILGNEAAFGENLIIGAHILPAATVSQKTQNEIVDYILSANYNASATIIFGGTRLGVQPSPLVPAFSSRGPNPVVPGILKPDVIAPGVNILAGWTRARSPTGLDLDERRVDFNIVSGTSMSCPHVSGLAALLKGAHPDWSPAAIKSALMTTAYTAYTNGSPLLDSSTLLPSTPFDHGAGHVDPQKALDPGLVYDAAADDYLDFLCAAGYTEDMIAVVAGRRFACTGGTGDLNYPSFVARFTAGSSQQTVTFTRTVTNVGTGNSSYSASLSLPASVKAVVEPQLLTFEQKGQRKSYTISFSPSPSPLGTVKPGFLDWSDGQHLVRSPIVFTWV